MNGTGRASGFLVAVVFFLGSVLPMDVRFSSFQGIGRIVRFLSPLSRGLQVDYRRPIKIVSY